MFGQYYRLRSADANLYLTMNSTSDADNVGCSLQARSPNNSKQIFMLGMNSSSNTYTLSPISSSSRKVLSLANNSNSNGVAIVLKSNTGASTQGWNIDLTTQGYFIKSYFKVKQFLQNRMERQEDLLFLHMTILLFVLTGNLHLLMRADRCIS